MAEPPPYPESRSLLAGKTVLVTAAAGAGIGFATAKRCVEEGAKVVLSDKHERRLVEASDQLAALGTVACSIPCDVSSQADVDRLFRGAIEATGGLDVVVNNAGLGGTKDIAEMTDDEWSIVLDISLGGTFRCTRAALQHMIPRRSGTIINLGSILGWRAQAGQGHYAAAKAGVMALTRAAAMEAAPHNIRVNCVAPSFAETPFLSKVVAEETLAELRAREAFGRAAEPWEVANVIVFLASDYSSYMTGEVVSVSAQHP
ncbi:MAG: SDR family oxidoreductase [Actinomycetota bacterium]